jgi:membrane-bound lytic murein transglycosylase D
MACVVSLVMAGCASPPVATPSGVAAEVPSTADTAPSATEAPPPVQPKAATDFAADVAVVPVPVPVDPIRPDAIVRLDDPDTQTDLWARVRRGFAMPDLDTDLVRERERWYASRPDYVERMTTRGSRYLFHIVVELETRGMPTELALLPFIESAFNPQAMSSAKASGMWQFMPATGRDFDLKQNVFRDDRRDVLASTRAALDYLQRLYGMFGDWHLALAAYNWGEGSVQRAIARNQKLGLPTDYQSLKMPDETRNYVPKLQAVKNIVTAPQAFSLTLPPVANHPYFLSVPIQRDIDVDVAARLAGISVDDFKTLNPQMNKPVILAAGTPQILLPYDNASAFIRKLGEHRAPLATWTAWVAPRNMRTVDAAREVGMTESLLREVNRIPPRMVVKAGSTLLVPRSERRQSDVAVQVADNATMVLAPDAPARKKVVLKAGKRDSVASVAKRYGVSASQVAEWNSVERSTQFKPGQQIVVYQTPRKPQGKRTASKGNAQQKASSASRQRAAAPRTASAKSASSTTPKAMRAVDR